MEAKINGIGVGVKSFRIEDTKNNEQILSNINHLMDSSTNFAATLSQDYSKPLKEFFDNLLRSEEYVKQQESIANVFACGGYLSLFDIETDSYIGDVHSMNEYMFQSKFYKFIPYNKDDQVVDLYTMKPILIDGKIQYFKL